MSLESPFAAVSGYIFLGERLGARELLGCALMLAGTFVAQWPASRRSGSQQPGSQQPGSQQPGSQQPGSQQPDALAKDRR
jgi:hypothetical protein